jgi:hypothetical protein
VAQRLASRYSQERIEEKIDFLEFLLETAPEKVEAPTGWLRRAIEENYGKPAGYVSKAEREAATRAEKQRLEEQERTARERKHQEVVEQQRREQEDATRRENAYTSWKTPAALKELWPPIYEELSATHIALKTHLVGSVLLQINGTTAVIGVTTPGAKDWLERTLYQQVYNLVAKRLTDPIERLEFVVL